MKLIERTTYLSEMLELADTPDIKVITGVRRSGKSKLMEALAQEIVERQPDANIIHINYNLTDFESIMEYRSMEAYVEERYAPNRQNYLFIDEVQMCASFEKAINSLHAREKYSIFITGSNAFLQSSDLATLFVGRTYEIPVYPFSFAEYLEYFPSRNIYDSLTAYISDGGMAGSYLYRTEDQKRRYINSEVLNALVVRDIVSKYKLRNEQLLHALIDYLMDNVGNLTSIRSIADTLESSRMKADHKTIGKYVDALCKAFAFYRFRRYDVRGKRYLRSEDKYYLVDQSFRFARLGTKNMDYGRVLENIVAMELLRRGYEVYVGVLYKKEIDFVAIKQGEKLYIQVANNISEEKTFEREVSPLLAIKDAFPKMLIARTYQPEYQHEGIRIVDAAEWLSNPIPQKE
ncbi:ATP-binding protein [uncultured Slackia sp.]|uniref:ATP-binding protein n=2 Tax=Slackia TaxID=84108 RepID=UPI002588BF7F|nr:ATP-binding protein [uncultured Slackia sp.]MEE1480710.1 ATP-binding protein [Slackia isoflavoniconvertens]